MVQLSAKHWCIGVNESANALGSPEQFPGGPGLLSEKSPQLLINVTSQRPSVLTHLPLEQGNDVAGQGPIDES